MSKRKRPTLRIFDQINKPPAVDPLQAGLRAFLAGDLNEAIAVWRSIDPQTDTIKAALAEACLRRALLHITAATARTDLQHAERLSPHDPRIQYLLGLAAQRAGDLAAAGARYRAVLQTDPAWPGAGLLLGLVALRRDPRVDLAALPGNTPEIQATLAPIQILLQGGQPADGPGAVEHFWHGLGLIRAGNGSAQEALDDNRSLPAARATAIRRYYRGVAAAQRGDLDAALKTWQHVSGDADTKPWLSANLAAALLQDNGAHLNPESLRGNDPFAQRLRALAAGNAQLAELLVRTYDNAAQSAAAAGDWPTAAAQWEQARELVSAAAGMGTPRPFWHNLAIAYEALERWAEAADAWRAMLRTRPRGAKRGGAAPESDYSDEQWSWIRTRVVECYKRAGTPGEAVTLFRQALKKDPEDLETRMQLASALLANEQEQAALNELQRILAIDPGRVDATLMLATIYGMRGDYRQSLQLLRTAHRELPDREDVTRALVALLSREGIEYHEAGWYAQAISRFEEAEKLAPDDWHFPIYMARVYADQGKHARARPLLQRAEDLAAGQPAAYVLLIECWAVAGQLKEARGVLERAEATATLPDDIYTELAIALLNHAAPTSFLGLQPQKGRRDEQQLTDLAVEIVEHGAERHAGNAQFFRDAAQALMLSRSEVAERMAAEAVRLDPSSADTLSLLGTIQALNGNSREGQQTLRTAARMARKARNNDQARQYEALAGLARDPQNLRMQLGMAMAMNQLDIGGLDDFGMNDDDYDL